MLHLNGEPFDQGRQHGLALREQIGHNLDVYYDRFLREGQLEAHDARDRAARYVPLLDGLPYFDALRGMALGSGFELLDLLVLNVRYELLYYQYGVCGIGQPDGCTSFAILPDASANGHLLLGQNWDWIPEVKGAVVHTREKDGLETLGFTEAGIVGAKIGLNSAGVGLTINGLMSTVDDWSRLVLPFHVRCYEILRRHTFADAVDVVNSGQRACSANFLIAQTPDRAIDLEAAPDGVNEITATEGAIVHANHFVDPARLGIEEPVTERRPHSYWRHSRMRALLDARAPVAVGDLEVSLQDHDNHPDGICRHENRDDPPQEWLITVTSAIMDLDERTLRLTDGPPCEHLYEGFSIPHTALLGH
ncbi:MAG TPA: C45 family peptidase [Chloroflexota bacterium]|nr:C45 family peptidase [Chloroflexota bacterium]